MLLAQAIAGRPIRVEEARAGEPTSADGHAISLRVAADAPGATVELVIQAGLIGAGSLDPVPMRRLLRHRRALDRYLALEGGRVAATLVDSLPGLAPRLSSLVPAAPLSASPEDSLRLALSGLRVDAPLAAFGVLRPRRVLAAARRHANAPVRMSAESDDDPDAAGATELPPSASCESTAETIDLLVHEARDGAYATSTSGSEQWAPGDAEDTGLIGRFLESLPRTQRQGPLFWLLRRFRAPVRERVGGPQRDLPADDRLGGAGSGSPRAVSLPSVARARSGPVSRVAGVYPEWDAEMNGYRRDWCTVFDEPQPNDAAGFPPGIQDRVLARRLQRLGLGLERRPRQVQGDEIDLDAAVEMRVQLVAGSAPDERVYLEKQRRRRDLGVLVLLDVSGSAAEPSPLGGMVHDHQRNAAVALVEGLHLLGDRVACQAFSSHGRAAVRMVPVKTFDETFGGLVLQRFGGLKPQGFTRLGAAIRHTTRLLERDSGVSRRVLVVLSDGQPYDFHRYQDSYAEADARRSLAEAHSRGIGCLCLTIAGAGDPVALRRVFGSAAYATAGDLHELRDQIGVLFRHALRHAERAGRTRPSPVPSEVG